MLTRVLVGVSLPLVLGSMAEPEDWKPFASKEGGFSALFPATPTEHKQKVKSPAGMVAVTFFTSEKAGAWYVVSFSEYPRKDVKAGSEQRRLDNAREGAVASAKGKLESEKETKLGKYPGRELLIQGDGKGEGKFVRTRIYAVNNRLYQSMIVGSKEYALGKEADRFFDSFKLTR